MCLEFDYWGKRKVMQVPVAKYRGGNQFGTNDRFGGPFLNFREFDSYVGGESIDRKSPLPAITDAQLRQRFPSLEGDASGRECTDYLAGLSGNNCATFCRNVDIAGFGKGWFDLPNLYELAVIYTESDNIDALDPSPAEKDAYVDNLLGMNSKLGRFSNAYVIGQAWTSSRMQAADNGCCINSDGRINWCNLGYIGRFIPCRVI